MRQHRITGHDGVGLEVFDLGLEEAPPILLIHGWSQHHLSWERQYPLAEEFRLIMPDLRGHGASDKPDAAGSYDNSLPWAADIAAIIDALSLGRPMLVGWSMGGAVAGDYVKHYGDEGISGFCLVDSFATTGSHMATEARDARAADDAVVAAGMTTSDQAADLSATLAFVRACFHQKPDADDLARIVGFNMLCPPHIRKAARQRDEDYRPYLAKMRVPAQIMWGAHDRPAPPMVGEEAAAAIPTARVLIYEECGHSPFWEEPDRFNADIRHFARHCFEMEPGT